MAATPKIVSAISVSGTVQLSDLIPIYVYMVNQGSEGDVYLNCHCGKPGALEYPAARGIRLQNWRPAAVGQSLVYSDTRGLIDESDPYGFGLCGGCNPDQECWPDPSGSMALLLECGWIDADNLLHRTDSRQLNFNVGGGGVSWPLVLVIGGVLIGGIALAKSR